MDIRGILERHHGVARTRTILASGSSAKELTQAWDDGIVDRVRKGVYALDRRADVAVAAAHGGALGCITALRECGVWVMSDDTRLHVAVGGNGRVHPHPDCTCVDHHDSPITVLGRVDPERALLQAAVCLGDEAFFAAYESAWRLGLLTRDARRRLAERLPRARRSLLALARGDADSGLESLFRLRIMKLGFLPRCQVQIDGVGRVDFLIGRTIIELDGRVNHDGPSERHRDLRRDAAAAVLGYRVLRFDYHMVIDDWPAVERTVLAAVR